MPKIKWICLATLLCLMLPLCGCGKQAADITIMDNFIVDSACGDIVNAPNTRFDLLLDEWCASHSDIEIAEKKRPGNGDISSLAVLGVDHLPDVFMADGPLGRLLAEKGLVLDITEYVPKDRIAQPFVYHDSVYAFPASAPSISVVIYEGPFPQTWTELYARQYKVAWGNNFTFDLLSPSIAANGAQTWLDNMIAADKEHTFLDDCFVAAIVEAVEYQRSGVLVEMTPEDAIQAFIQRKYGAILLNGENIYTLLESIEPERRDSLMFTTLPFHSGSGYMPMDVRYGFFINANVAEDAQKMALCIDLVKHLSQTADTVRGKDAALEHLDDCVKRAKPCRICGLYLNSQIWAQLTNAEKTPMEMAINMQNAYDQYYLNTEDYSKQLDFFSQVVTAN